MRRLILLGGCFLCATVLLAAEGPDSSANTDELGSGRPPASLTSKNPIEQEYRKLLEQDEEVLEEVDKLIAEHQAFLSKGAGIPNAELNRKIQARLEKMKSAYEDFLRRNPKHVKARIAYGSFLGDVHDEPAAQAQLERALELEKNDPAIYNNLANIYGHIGSVKKAFEYYDKAIQLSTNQPVYYQNLATTVYLFRPDAMEFYGITEEQVFNKALDLYRKALKLDPTNFTLATDLAQSYYGIRPMRTEEALLSWTNALALARDDFEKQGVHIHLARIKMLDRRFTESRGHLNQVQDERYGELKKRLERNWAERSGATNSPVASPERSASSTGSSQ